jgi:hypothetical protein
MLIAEKSYLVDQYAQEPEQHNLHLLTPRHHKESELAWLAYQAVPRKDVQPTGELLIF